MDDAQDSDADGDDDAYLTNEMLQKRLEGVTDEHEIKRLKRCALNVIPGFFKNLVLYAACMSRGNTFLENKEWEEKNDHPRLPNVGHVNRNKMLSV